MTDGASRLDELQPVAPAGCEVVIYSSEECAAFFLFGWTEPLTPFYDLSPILEPYRSAFHTNFMDHAVTRAEYQETGSEASRRKFRSAILTGISVNDGTGEGDGIVEEGRQNINQARSKRSADERGTVAATGSASGSRSSVNTRLTRTGTRQSGRESTTKRK
jgi:actin-related protein 6